MVTMFILLTLRTCRRTSKSQELSDWTLVFYVSYVLIASFLIFNLFIGIVINSMEEARAIELHRAEREVLDEDGANDAAGARGHPARADASSKTAVEDLERELAAQKRAPLRSPPRRSPAPAPSDGG